MIRPTDRHALKLPNNRMLTKASAVFVLFPTHIRYSHQMHNQSNELKVRNSATSRRHSILPKAAQTRHSTRYDVDCALTRPTTGRCSCPASLVSRNFFCCRPRVCKVFCFLLRSVGRRDLSAGPENTTQGVFFCSGPGERQGKEKPRAGTGPEPKKNTSPGCFFFLLRPRGKAGEGEAPCRHGARAKKKRHHPGCFFFAAAPAKGKGRRSPVGRRHGARAKKKTPPRLFFLAPAPGQGRGRRSPVPTRGQSKKQNTTQGVFFAAAPAKGKGRRSPVGRRHGARAKKKHHPGCFFFCSAPGKPGAGAKKKTPWVVFFFALAPCRRPTGLLLPLPFAGAAAKKKKHPGWCFFWLWPRAGTGLLLPCLSPGPEQKKNTLGGVFFFAAAPRGRSLTHCGPGWRCLPLAGVVFSFCCGLARTGVVFFFCCGPARTLTHSLWAGAISARPGRCSFLLRPRRVFLDNSKKMSGVLHRV